MTTYELKLKHEKRALEMYVKEFKSHEAHYEQCPGARVFDIYDHLVWKKPNTCVYQVNFLCAHGAIWVSGDIGYGTFMNGYGTVLELAGLDVGYAKEKLADIGGRPTPPRGDTFCPQLCEEQMKVWMKDPEVDGQLKKNLRNWEGNENQAEEWRQYLYHDGGVCAEDLSEVHDFGLMTHPRVIGWLLAIDLAAKQLEKTGVIS